tara:strand:- start:1748 stop:3379 length:1632 start_codon:yes stop_codon:yes gene_type:complete
MSPELLKAVQERLELGYSHDDIKNELRSVGYSEEVLDAVLAEATGEGGPAPIPMPGATADSAGQAGVLQLPSVSSLFTNGFNYAASRLDLAALLAVPYIGALVLEYMANESGETMFVMGAALVTLVAVIAYFVVMAMLLFTVVNHDRRVSLNESFEWARKGIWGLLWIYLLSFLVTMGGFMLLIIPGIIISLYIYFAQYVYITEGKRGMEALMRSRDLVWGNWWAVALKLLGITLILFGVFLVFGFIIGLATISLEGNAFDLVFEIITQVFSAFATIIGFHIGADLYRSLASAKPVPSSDFIDAKTKYVGLVAVGLIFPGVMALVAFQLNNATNTASDAIQKMNLNNARVTAELHYASNGVSYEGVCTEIEPLVSSAKYSDCVDDVDTWALSMTTDEGQSCVDVNTSPTTGGINIETGLCQNSDPTDGAGDAKQRANELRGQDTGLGDPEQIIAEDIPDISLAVEIELLFIANDLSYDRTCEKVVEELGKAYISCTDSETYYRYMYTGSDGAVLCADSERAYGQITLGTLAADENCSGQAFKQ